MDFYKGHLGSVKFSKTGVSPAAIAQVTSWTMTIDKQIIECTPINETYTRSVGGIIKGSGSVSLVYSANSSADFIKAVNTVSDTGIALFELYVNTTANKKISFNAIISKASYSANASDVATMSCDFITTGAITLDL